MTATTFLAALEAGQDVRGLFACTHKRLRSRRHGGPPYLALMLRDRSGCMEGRVWERAEKLGARFARGDVVRVVGRTARYEDALQLHISDIAKASAEEAERAALLPRSYRNLDELEGFLDHLVGEIHDRALRATAEGVLGDEAVRPRLRRSPATLVGHHAYLGGLLEHTVAVASLAQQIAQLHPQLNADLLLTAAVLHDVGRVREFTYDRGLTVTEQGLLLGHVALGQQMIAERACGALGATRLAELLHCVGRHHAAPGDPAGFELPEALALARLNALDADAQGAFERQLSIVGSQP